LNEIFSFAASIRDGPATTVTTHRKKRERQDTACMKKIGVTKEGERVKLKG